MLVHLLWNHGVRFPDPLLFQTIIPPPILFHVEYINYAISLWLEIVYKPSLENSRVGNLSYELIPTDSSINQKHILCFSLSLKMRDYFSSRLGGYSLNLNLNLVKTKFKQSFD